MTKVIKHGWTGGNFIEDKDIDYEKDKDGKPIYPLYCSSLYFDNNKQLKKEIIEFLKSKGFYYRASSFNKVNNVQCILFIKQIKI